MAHAAPLEPKVLCTHHSIPHEDCPHCLTTVTAMRPTVFAELAAAEMRSGTECCSRCDYVYYEVAASCPRCAEPHPFNLDPRDHAVQAPRVPDFRVPPVADLSELTLRDFVGSNR
jgi:hypothetical protein